MPGGFAFFGPDEFDALDEAVFIAEDLTSDYFVLSETNWVRHPFEVRTLKDITPAEHPGPAFAHLVRYVKGRDVKASGRDSRQWYRICLNDPKILKETSAGSGLELMPLLTYIMTHELVHIARFGRFQYNPLFEDRAEEELRVHRISSEILKGLNMSGMIATLSHFDCQHAVIDRHKI